MDFTYWFPWKYLGVRFQGTGASMRGGGGTRTKEVTLVPGFAPVSVTGGGGSVAAGVLASDLLLRYPLDQVGLAYTWRLTCSLVSAVLLLAVRVSRARLMRPLR
jgi:hypothetical protein